MADAGLSDIIVEAEDLPVDLDDWIARELAEIIQEAEKVPAKEEPEATSWFYQVPFPGVRYYTTGIVRSP